MIASTRTAALAATGLALTLGVAPGCSASAVRATGTQSITIPQVESGALAVETRNGSVKVVAVAGRTSIDVTAQITCTGLTQDEAGQRLAATRLMVERDPQRVLTVKPVFGGGPRNGDGASITIELPASPAALATTGASATSSDAISITTSNGQVSITGAGGTLVVNTSNGAVAVRDHAGPAKIATSNGRIEVANLGGPLDARTSNGKVSAEGIAGSTSIRSSNGSVTVKLLPQEQGPVNISTSNGAIGVTVGPAFTGGVAFATSNGRVSINDAAGRVSEKKISKSKGQITVGAAGATAGSPASKVTTSNGRIEFTIE